MTIDTYKILGQLSNPSAGVNTDIYTAPSPGGAICTSLWCSNRNAADHTVSLRVLIGGSASVTNPWVRYSVTVPAFGYRRIADGLCLGPGDKLTVQADNANMDFTLFGDEQTSLGTLVPKTLGIVTPASATDTTLYTVPAAHSAIVRAVAFANFGGEQLIRARIDAASAGPQTYLAYDVPIEALPGSLDPNIVLDAAITLGAGDKITVRQDGAGANMTVACWGLEVG